MTAEPPSERTSRLWRPAGMLLQPGRTLDAVAEQRTDTVALTVGYILPLAAIGPVCGAIGFAIFGASIAGVHLRPPIWEIFAGAAFDYVLSVVSVYLLALIVWALAGPFGGSGGRIQALKLTAYACTAVWVAGLFSLYPTLGFPLQVLGVLYSLYALYLGLGTVMRVPADRALTYFAAVLLSALLLGLVLRVAVAQFR